MKPANRERANAGSNELPYGRIRENRDIQNRPLSVRRDDAGWRSLCALFVSRVGKLDLISSANHLVFRFHSRRGG